MILDTDAATVQSLASFPTLDDLFRRTAAQHPHAVALCDPPNRIAITGTPPRNLTYSEADRAIAAIAGQLRGLGLPTDAVVATQLPNTIESVLMLLGIWRAGMIAAPLPMLWRANEIVAAVQCSGASALFTTSRIDETDHLAIAMQAAAACFPIRHVGVFGATDIDGIVPLDTVFETMQSSTTAIPRRDKAAAHVALVTWETTPAGTVPLARNHLQILAAAPALAAAGMLNKDGATLSSIPLTSFAGVVLGLVNWLFNGNALILHHPFEADAFATQCHAHRCATLVLPGPLVPALSDAGILSDNGDIVRVIALWRSASQWRSTRRWAHGRGPQLIDMLALGEFAIAASPRDADGIPDLAALSIAGPNEHPPLAIARTRHDTLALRGAMVPTASFPPGAAAFPIDGDGFLDTALPLRRSDGTTAVPLDQYPGVARVGGYPLRIADLERQVATVDPYATVAILPHALTGSRLAGTAAHPAAVIEALASVNPLVGTAFVPRRTLA
jgi:non-ribosomal peptide synthetase component F